MVRHHIKPLISIKAYKSPLNNQHLYNYSGLISFYSELLPFDF